MVLLPVVLFSLPVLEGVHLVEVGAGAVPLLLLLHILVVHLLGLLFFHEFELVLLVGLLVLEFLLLLCEQLTALPLLLGDLGLLFIPSLLLHGGLLRPYFLLSLHASVSLHLLLPDSLGIHLLDAVSFGLSSCHGGFTGHAFRLGDSCLLFLTFECSIDFGKHFSLTLVLHLLFVPINLRQIAVLTFKALIIRLFG